MTMQFPQSHANLLIVSKIKVLCTYNIVVSLNFLSTNYKRPHYHAMYFDFQMIAALSINCFGGVYGITLTNIVTKEGSNLKI